MNAEITSLNEIKDSDLVHIWLQQLKVTHTIIFGFLHIKRQMCLVGC